jgi:glycosyltransferase involved in cell wall biosynthesis
MPETLSIIIPTLNEAARLPGLLHTLLSQTRPPDEIIIADAGSTDETIALAAQAGVKVVPGGKPAVGRNAGARAATGTLLLFLDADVILDPEFIEVLLHEFSKRHLGTATTFIAPVETTSAYHLLCEITNLYLLIMQPVSPHAPGFCILTRRTVFDQVNGFDESVLLAEDHRYVQQAARIAPFGVLGKATVRTSMRRIEKEGLVRLALKYFYCELYAISGRPIYHTPFSYEFGKFTPTAGPALVDIAAVRQQMGRLIHPLKGLSEPLLDALQKLGSYELSRESFDEILIKLQPRDISILHRYLRRRLGQLSRLPHQVKPLFREVRSKLRNLTKREILWLGNALPEEWRPFFSRDERKP